ncbi:MAG: hypothetical protein HMLKMBBP_01126 [Planctomycetes bacterium]|nr:hypothetical protein [Planctomycetota bacterium]
MLRSIGLAAFVLLAVAWAVIGPNRILCVGADGHVGVEIPHSACCDSGPDAPLPDAPEDCGPCVDLEVPAAIPALGSVQSLGKQLPVPHAHLSAGIVVDVPICDAAPLARARGRGADPPPPALAHLRTVRLRC